MKDRLDLKVTLMMRFQLSDQAAEQLSQQWLAAHPHHSWSQLRALVLQGQVTYRDGELVDTSSISEPIQESPIQAKYRGKVYSLTPDGPAQSPSQPRYVRRYRGKAY